MTMIPCSRSSNKFLAEMFNNSRCRRCVKIYVILVYPFCTHTHNELSHCISRCDSILLGVMSWVVAWYVVEWICRIKPNRNVSVCAVFASTGLYINIVITFWVSFSHAVSLWNNNHHWVTRTSPQSMCSWCDWTGHPLVTHPNLPLLVVAHPASS